MKDKIVHFIYIPFTGLGAPDFRGQEWFEERQKIFRDFTLKSFANQTCKNFIIWISFRPEERDNLVVKQIAEDIKKTGLRYIFTFDGVAMYDDRGTNHNIDLMERLGKMLKVLEPEIKDAEWIFKTDCGSDDMLAKEAIEEIQREEPRDRGATYYLNGYIFNAQTGQVAEWLRNTSCSKYTVMFPRDTFLDAQKHWHYIRDLESHEFLPLRYDATRLPDNRYACVVHGHNISTNWENNFKGEEFLGKERDNIKILFGL